MWERWNQGTKIFEKSTDNGQSWTPLGLDASIITQGVIDPARLPAGSVPDGAALSAFGRATNSVGPQASIVAAADGDFLRRAGTTLGFGPIVPANLAAAFAWQSYTPVWASAGTQPAIGNGLLFGKYIQIGKLVSFWFFFRVGSTSTLGTGAYYFTLPTTVIANGPITGSGYVTDASAGPLMYGCNWQSGTGNIVYPRNLAVPMGYLQPTVPMAWAVNDEFTGGGIYEAA